VHASSREIRDLKTLIVGLAVIASVTGAVLLAVSHNGGDEARTKQTVTKTHQASAPAQQSAAPTQQNEAPAYTAPVQQDDSVQGLQEHQQELESRIAALEQQQEQDRLQSQEQGFEQQQQLDDLTPPEVCRLPATRAAVSDYCTLNGW
jgi:negative regulator of sigma E activity